MGANDEPAGAAAIAMTSPHSAEALDALPQGIIERFRLDDLPYDRPTRTTADLLRLDGKVALVTGGGGDGLGHATCHRLAEQGARVGVLDMRADAAAATATEVGERWGVPTCSVQANVGDWAQVVQAVESVQAQLGDVDVLVNNAGGALHSNVAFVDVTHDALDAVIRLNLVGVMHCTKAVLPAMLRRGSGRIVNVSSEGAKIGMVRSSVYNSCKAGIISLTQDLAHELGRRGVTVVAVCPGLMVAGRQLELLRGATTAERLEPLEHAFRRATIGRCSVPDEVASVIAFLASDAGAYVHGTAVSVGGGIAD
jgi:NAD(P)-dependent dehydrogenase (short-subunit alcohol dehydrogenase family)